MITQQRASPQGATQHRLRRHLRIASLLMSLYAACSLASCDAGPTTDYPVHIISVPTVQHHGDQGYRVIQGCIDDTSSFDPTLRQQALSLITASVQNLVQPGWSGASVYVTLVGQDPTLPGATITLRLPAIAAYPTPPPLEPTPQTDPNSPYASAPAQATIAAQDDQAITSYNAAVHQVQQQLATVQAQVQSWTAQVMARASQTQHGPADETTCLGLASLRFHDEPGKRFVVVAGPVGSPGAPSGWYDLDTTRLFWVDAVCPSLATCSDHEGAWASLLNAYGMQPSNHRWYDAGESQQLADIFSQTAG